MEFMSHLSISGGGTTTDRSRSRATKTRLTNENIKYLESLFKKQLGEGGENELTKADFQQFIGTKNQFFTERVFDTFDTNKSGSISLKEYIDEINSLAAGDEAEAKIQFLFKVYDADGDGLLEESEIEKVLRGNMEENGMEFPQEQIHALTRSLFSVSDVDKGGSLTYEELKGQLEKYPGLLENLALSIERWLVPEKPPVRKSLPIWTKIKSSIPRQLSWHYIKNNYIFLCWLSLIFIINITLFTCRVSDFRNAHPNATIWLVIARGCGQCLNFDCILIVITMLSQTLTYLRSHGAVDFIPIDQHIFFHQLTGWLIATFGLIHTLGHFVNFAEVGFQPNHASNSNVINSGVLLTLIILTMVICSQPFIRRDGYFNVFYWTHLSYWLVFLLLISHAHNFWKWFSIPGLIFLFEQAHRYFQRSSLGRGKSIIKTGLVLPSKVTHLVIDRPPGFTYSPGDYVFIKIPAIAKFEYHPFTISSCPEQKGEIWLHIRGVGEWTNRLHKYFVDEKLKTDDEETKHKVAVINRVVARAWDIYIDGPYGAPSSAIFRAEHAVLIGTGIGVTPFASILQSIMRRYWLGLSRLLAELEKEQAEKGIGGLERFLDMHLYITSALEDTDMRALGLAMAMDLLYEKDKRDLITGLKNRTLAGRPDFKKIFESIKAQNKGQVTVFFCGAPGMTKVLKDLCDDFEFTFRKECF